MKYTGTKLAQLQIELRDVVKQVQEGKLTPGEAADKILYLREEMDAVITHLRNKTNETK